MSLMPVLDGLCLWGEAHRNDEVPSSDWWAKGATGRKSFCVHPCIIMKPRVFHGFSGHSNISLGPDLSGAAIGLIQV